jgi:hypothetical protein
MSCFPSNTSPRGPLCLHHLLLLTMPLHACMAPQASPAAVKRAHGSQLQPHEMQRCSCMSSKHLDSRPSPMLSTPMARLLTSGCLAAGARDVVFFMHGILDTSLGWVANGVVGSQAFAAWDAGHDVFLGNSRSNPPRAHVDPAMQGARYWRYTLNELGMEDVAAQVGAGVEGWVVVFGCVGVGVWGVLGGGGRVGWW